MLNEPFDLDNFRSEIKKNIENNSKLKKINN